MTVHRNAAVAALVGAVPLLLTVVAAGPAAAHGAPVDPVSRVASCSPMGERTAQSAACRAAVAANGGRGFEDWDNLRVPDVRGRDRQMIPDGKLCSAGIDAYKGLDTPRADWPSTRLSAGSGFTLTYRSTIPHKGTFSLYLTKEGYDPATPLSWSDLRAKPIVTATDPALEGGSYRIKGKLPAGTTGRHVLYTVWRNSDTPDTYYSCSDVTFAAGASRGNGGGEDKSRSAADTADGAAAAGAPDAGAPDAAAPEDAASDKGAADPADRPSPEASPAEPAAAVAGSERDVLPMVVGGAAVLAVAAVGTFVLLRRRLH
ncbi:lytic polysaccharide monooxygenase [Streptomyces sp. NPDC004647]|uniref:lytic polysaccharide monooxygenase n=1 Tax=Streptomyces sp. NPDC004647 TaxID=3154671 RepID=UPI0033BE774F